MTVDPRAALDRLIAALEAHYSAVTMRRSEDDPGVDDAYYVLADAFDVYDESLGLEYGEATPFVLADEDDDDEEDLEQAVVRGDGDADDDDDDEFDDEDEDDDRK
ncbi:hypothetical protein GCM10010401_23300 [Rarobacter faecitabidus]|uniref:Primosomal protein n=1 Tax=Rarobacter faecitabidus TaxID=13243 RepID=A0A542ZVX9_RARFA|nr:primosomal protein [Rarobacter faecitabidus]TQL64527.1 hypothetical protein FB461_1032 [Rarobacter faecitabidus]